VTVLRVASYNTRDFLDDRSAAARVVRSLAPDVLCLQEVPRRLGGAWRVARFARECGMRTVGHHRGSGGTTILVSPAVTVSVAAHERLSTALLDRTRGYAVAQLAAPGWPALTAVSLHLSLRATERRRHVAAVLERLAGLPGPLVVAGDLNELADGAAYRALAAPLRVVTGDRPTYPAHAPRLALDVVFVTDDVRVVEGRPARLDESDVRAASDHRPVWVDLVPA